MLISDASQPTVSPDGSSIAYTWMQNKEIWIADGLGQNSRLLVPRVEGESIAGLLWSPKYNRLVFDRVSVAGAENATGSTAPADTDALRPPTYESVDASSGKLLCKEQNIRFDSGVLLNDGSFVFAVNGTPASARLMMVKTDSETGSFLARPQPATPPQAWDMHMNTVESLSASANGKTMGAVLAKHTADTYWANIDWPGPTLKGETRLTGELGTNYPQAWSPNGDAVVFDGDNGASRICKQRLGETELEIMAKLPEFAAMANFSPDGRWILFADYAGLPVHAIGIFGVPVAGSPPRQLSTTGTIDEFHCSDSFNGACLMRETVNKEFVFHALDPVRGMGQELGRMNWESTVLGDWSLSPDGSTVAMADHDPDHPAIQLVHFSPHGSAVVTAIHVQGFGVVRESTWASDGKGFFVETKTASVFDLLYVDRAGHATVLRQSPISIWGVPSRDGKKLAFPGQTVRSNVWIGQTSPTLPGS